MVSTLNRMRRNKILIICVVPLIFFVAVLLLSSHLSASISSDAGKKVHLVSAYGVQGGPKRFQSGRLRLKELLDFKYDSEKLAALGMVKDEQDEAIKSEGKFSKIWDTYQYNYNLRKRKSL